jgi:hypothetical protein
MSVRAKAYPCATDPMGYMVICGDCVNPCKSSEKWDHVDFTEPVKEAQGVGRFHSCECCGRSRKLTERKVR